MDRLVYLFELDSVRNSKKEVEIGQKVMYEEIVLNGNSVVLSFNQLADSEAFLYAIKSEESYKYILQLFQMEVLRFSPFGSTRTPSKYIQDSIDKAISKGNDSFIFSALPVTCDNVELLQKIKRALQYSDLSGLQDQVDQCTDMQKREQLEYIIRYIRLILQLSTQELKQNPRKDGERIQFVQCYERVIHMLQKGMKFEYRVDSNSFDRVNALLPDTLAMLSEVQNKIKIASEKSGQEKQNNRTNWIQLLNEVRGPEAYLAEAIVDLCYNYTVESSIEGVCRHYIFLEDTSFERDFSIRLQRYWKQYLSMEHSFGDKDKEQIMDYHLEEEIDWKQAVRVIRRSQEYRQKRKPSNGLRNGNYETNLEKEEREWKRTIWKSFWRSSQIAVAYLIAFVAFDLLLGMLSGSFEHTGAQLHMPVMLMQILETVLFGILASYVSLKFGIPDILESIQNIFICFVDGVSVRKKRERKAYQNVYCSRE